jgi:hypothetical protein
MSTIQLKVVSTGLFFLFVFLFGFWLSNSGKPYNVVILTIHKLISLAALVFLAVTVCRMHQASALNSIELTACVATALLFVGTIIIGGLLSADKPMPQVISTIHQLTPYLTVLSTAVTLYLLHQI